MTDSAAVSPRDVARGAGTTLLARLGAAIELVAQPLYVAMFGLPAYGLYAVLWAAVNLVENVADLGMTGALQRVVPQAASEAEAVAALRAALLFGVGPCLLVAAAASLAAPAIAPLFNAAAEDQARLAGSIRLFAWVLPLWAFVEIATSALRARRAFGPEIRLRIFWEQLARLALAGVLWFAGLGLLALFAAHLASLALVGLLSLRLLARHYDLRLLVRPAGPGIARETLAAGLAVLPANAIARAFGDGPPLALNLLLPGSAGAVAGGLFVIARKIASLVQIVRSAFAYVLAPLASLATRGDPAQLTAIYGFATRVSAAVAIPLGLILAALAPAILSWFGREARVAVTAVVLLVLARTAEAVFGAAAPIQQVVSRYRHQLLPSVAGLACAVLLAAAALPQGGLEAMAGAIAVGVVVAAVLPVLQLWRHDGIHPFGAAFVRAVLVAGAIGGGVLLAGRACLALPPAWQLVPAVPLLLGALWLSARFALPADDRRALGKTGRALRLA